MRQAATHSELVRRRQSTVSMSAPKIVPGALPAYEGSPVFFVERTATPVTGRTAKPRALPLLASERPFHLDRDDLGMTVERNGDLGPTQTTDAQPWVGFQQPVIKPFQRPSASEGSDHLGEINLREGRLYACLQNFTTLYVPPEKRGKKRENVPLLQTLLTTTTTPTTYSYRMGINPCLQ